MSTQKQQQSQVEYPPEPIATSRTALAGLLRQKWMRLNRQNEHWMCSVVGQEGMGKSHTALRIGELLDSSFSADQVFFDPSNVLQRLRDEEYSSGDVWVFDEAGVSLGNRTWQDSGQVKLNQALQLVRSHNVGFVFTLPRITELDKQTRGRLQNVIDLQHKRDGSHVRGIWWSSNIDRMGFSNGGRGTYWDKPSHGGDQVDAVQFTPPSQEIVEPYETVKQEFQERVYDEAMDELADGDAEDEDDDTLTGAVEIANDIHEKGADDYVRSINNGARTILDKDRISLEYDVGRRTAKKAKTALMDKMDRGDLE
jgi:hypothetical protein